MDSPWALLFGILLIFAGVTIWMFGVNEISHRYECDALRDKIEQIEKKLR